MSPKIERLLNIMQILLLIEVVAFIGWFIYELGDMIKDHQCTTTTDIKWYIDNNCIKYCKECK